MRTDYRGSYTYRNGNRYQFQPLRNGATIQDGQSYVSGLAGRYNFSIRSGNFNGSLGGGNGAFGWTWVGAPAFCNGPACPFNAFYTPATGGVNNGNVFAANLISRLGADRITWYGFSFANIDYLADNVMTEEMMRAWAGRDRAEIGVADASSEGLLGYSISYSPRLLPFAIENGAQGFLRQCRNAYGQYVELEQRVIDGNQCSYLQCRYVYEGGTAISCLNPDSKITMADGSKKLVTELKLGDRVKGSDGDHKIVAANAYQSALRVMWGINGGGALLTGNHPLRTKDGWKLIDAEAAKAYRGKPGFAAESLKVGDVLLTEDGEVPVKSIERHAAVDPMTTYNIKIEGNAGFFANGIEVKGFDKMEMKYE